MISSALALALFAPSAFAQDASQQDTTPVAGDPVRNRSEAQSQPTQADDPTEQNTVDELVVTGSRLRQRDLTANSPIETVTAEELESAGTVTVETFLNQLPQVVPSVSTAANNPSANGAAFIDLRGLGPERNLILLDGRRLVGADEGNLVDVNIIPTPLVERVEVITGGASSVYGPDAVSGVVNFILKNDFEGVEGDAQYQISERGDAAVVTGSLTLGGNFNEGRGNAVLNFSYANRDVLGKGEREFTAQAANLTSFFPGGSYRTAGNAPSQAAVNAVFARYGVAAGAVQRTGGSTGFGFNADNTLFATGALGNPAFEVQNFRRDPSEIATAFFPDIFSFNFEPYNILILPLERQTFSTFVNYDISPMINVYGQAIFANYNAATALAPSPAPTGVNPTVPCLCIFDFTIPVTNPFIPQDLRDLLASRTGDNPGLPGTGPDEDFAYRFRALSLGPRIEEYDNNVYHVLAGMKLDLGGDWEGDVYYSQGGYDQLLIQRNNLRVRRFEQLLDSPTGGTEFCTGGFNPFGQGLNAECAAFVNLTAKNSTRIEQDNAVAVFNGPLPWALPAGEIQTAFGAEYRGVDFDFLPDTALQPGEVAGFNGQQPLTGAIHFWELFTEASFPLLADAPFAEALDLTVGYRLTESDRSGMAHSYKAELSWVPIEQLRLRAGYQRAIRAPSIGELFAPFDENNPQVSDPCNADADRTAQIVALCEAQARALGFSPAAAAALVATYEQGNDQIQSLVGGNPNLEPEEGDTITAGVVWRPTWQTSYFQGLAFSVDYYNIRIEKAIFEADPQGVANACYNIGAATNPTFDPNNEFCQQFGRSAGDFSIVNLLQPEANQGLLETSGVDLSLGFRTPLADLLNNPWFGTLNVALIATHLLEFKQQESPLQPVLDFAGTIGDDYGETLPEWKLNVNLGWEAGPFAADLRGRYIGEMPTHRNEVIAGGDDPDSTGVGSAWYWDLATRWAVTETAEVRFGVLNLFDREVEQYDPFIDAQTDPSTYDVIGRRYFVGLNLRF